MWIVKIETQTEAAGEFDNNIAEIGTLVYNTFHSSFFPELM